MKSRSNRTKTCPSPKWKPNWKHSLRDLLVQGSYAQSFWAIFNKHFQHMYCRLAQGITALLHIYLALTFIFAHTHTNILVSVISSKFWVFLFCSDMSRKFDPTLSNGDGAIYEGQGLIFYTGFEKLDWNQNPLRSMTAKFPLPRQSGPKDKLKGPFSISSTYKL